MSGSTGPSLPRRAIAAVKGPRNGASWRPATAWGWLAAVVAGVGALVLGLAVLLAVVPVAWGGLGLLGVLALLFSVQFVGVAAAAAAVALVARRRAARAVAAAAWLGAASALVIAVWPTWSLVRHGDALGVPVSLGEALLPVLNDQETGKGVPYMTAPDGTVLRLDVWKADRGTHPPGARRPAIVKVHGGAWTMGSRGEAARWSRFLAERGFHVFDIDYRLAPVAGARDAVADVKCAIGWVRRHASSLDVDPARVSVFGSSAGGHLALLAAVTPGLRELPASCSVPAGKPVRSVINLYGPVDLATTYDRTGSPRVLRPEMLTYLGGPPHRRPDTYRLLSPVTHVGRGAPPVLMVMGDKDRIVPAAQADALEAAFDAAGAASEIIRLPATDHGFDANWTAPATQIARGVVERFLSRHGR